MRRSKPNKEQPTKEQSNKDKQSAKLRYGARLRQNIREMRNNAPFGEARLQQEDKESKQ